MKARNELCASLPQERSLWDGKLVRIKNYFTPAVLGIPIRIKDSRGLVD